MLKMIAIGNLTGDPVLKTNEETGKPYAIMRIASDRRYKSPDGEKLTDFISIKVRGVLAERCAEFARKGCKIAASGDFETITFAEEPERQPGFLLKATEVEFLSPRKELDDAAELPAAAQQTKRPSHCGMAVCAQKGVPNMTAYLDGYSGYSGVPEDAAAEILEKLMTHQQISSDEVAQILKRYGVCGEPEALQIAYRKKVGQRLIASLRDPYGRREVFSTGSTYVLVDCCNDRDALEHIHKKLDKDMEAVDQASCKIDNRLQVLQRFSRYRRKRK